MSLNLLLVDNISFSYSDGHTVLKDVTLEIGKNELVIIQGKSGAGKSTFLKLFNRFNDSTKGRILFHNREIKEYSIEDIRRSIIYLPQLPLMIEDTIEENLRFPFSFHAHKDKKYNPLKAKEWFEYFQMGMPLNHNALKLSIGQKQRIALIRAMLLEPEVLLLDEPGSALDSGNKRLIEQKIESMVESSRVTVVMATHSEVSFSGKNHHFFDIKDKKLIPRLSE